MPTPTGLPKVGEVWELQVRILGDKGPVQRVVVLERTTEDAHQGRPAYDHDGRVLMRRYRITLTANPDAPDNVPVTLDRLVLDVTIKDDRQPNDLGSWAARQLLVSSYLSITSVEPLAEQTRAQVTGDVSGLNRDEVTAFLADIGYFDEQEAGKESSQEG